MVNNINIEELNKRIKLNFNHLSDFPYYKSAEIFSPSDYDWYGDKEGRALLAFVSHYKISGKKIPCMEYLINELPHRLNLQGFLGPVTTDIIHEQQLSGHSWLLRGLCEYYEQFGNDFCLEIIENIIENLYLPTLGKYKTYPIYRAEVVCGEVSGQSSGIINGWRLSTDIGCAFMSIDGLSHAYKITKNKKIKTLLDEMTGVYLSVDKVKIKAQTHCTLSAARGMLRMYNETGDPLYIDGAKSIFDLYIDSGMTYTYQNLNWWGRPDSWTEPCAIVDSLMVALELYKIEKDEKYRKIACRIYHNGMATVQRDNGGAGTDTLVCNGGKDHLGIDMYEAYFCCTMRLAEGLWYVNENKEYLYYETFGNVVKNKNGVYSDGDIIYAKVSKELSGYTDITVTVDGMKLSPIVKYYKVPEETALKAKQQILF